MRPFALALRRLRAQRLAAAPFGEPCEVVRHLVAVQAQDYLGALWGVGVRMRDPTEARVEQALADGSIVRTWPMRGTLHLVAREDVRWLLALLGPRSIARAASRLRQLGLDEATFARSRKVLERALQRAQPITRPAVWRLLQEAQISTAGQRGIYIVWLLAQQGLLCFGPRQGKQQAFVLLDAWVPPARPRPREEALGELALRYFAARGPATAADFTWWSGLPAGEARAAIESVASQLERAEIGGQVYWLCGRSPAPGAAARRAWLLPPFDELVVGYADRAALVEAAHLPRLGAGGMLNPVLVVGKRIEATWTRALRRGGVDVRLRPFAPLGPQAQRAAHAAAARYAAFLGVPLLAP